MNLNHQILIALPDMQDPRFNQAIILICEHNEEGAMGFVLNKPTKIDTKQVFTDLNLDIPENNHSVLNGGPLNEHNGFVLHNDSQVFKSSIKIHENITLTTSKDLLVSLAQHQYQGDWQFILGYSGWTAGQLESEISENTWLTCPINQNLIFNTPKEQQWEKALALIGINDYKKISGVGHA